MKALLRNNLGPYPLSFEELSTLLAPAESILNSRPLTPMEFLPVDGEPALTPGHFQIGKPLLTPPIQTSSNFLISLSRRWKLVNQLSQDLWEKWQYTYLQSVQAWYKWHKTGPNFKERDVVFLKDQTMGTPHWPLALVLKTYPRKDGLVRIVDVRCRGKTYRRPVHKFVLAPSNCLLPTSAPWSMLRPHRPEECLNFPYNFCCSVVYVISHLISIVSYTCRYALQLSPSPLFYTCSVTDLPHVLFSHNPQV